MFVSFNMAIKVYYLAKWGRDRVHNFETYAVGLLGGFTLIIKV